MRRIGYWAAALIIVAGCTEQKNAANSRGAAGDPASAAAKHFTIAVIPKAATHEFWKSVHFGAAKAADELGNVDIQWKSPAHDDNREEQGNLVEDFVTRNVDGICLAPIDSHSLLDRIKGAKQANIPTVIFDSGVGRPQRYHQLRRHR